MISLLLAATPDSEAFNIGYFIGAILGVLVILGAFAFSIVAIVKACTRRTTGWIVAGSIGGVFLLFFGGAFLFGVVTGFMKARQRSLSPDGSPEDRSAVAASATAQEIQGRDIPYKVTLPPGWAARRAVNDFDLMASRRSLYFGVIAEEGNMGGSEAILNFAQNRLRRAGSEVAFGETSTVRIDGRDWLTFTAKCQVQKIPFAYQYTVYAGPEGSYQLLGWTLQNLFDRDAGTLRDLTAAFRFPPALPASSQATPEPTAAPPQVLVGDRLNYKLTIPEDWTIKHKAGAFDLEVSHRTAYVGVVAEEGSLGTPQVALKVVQDNLRKKSTELQMNEAYEVKIDGRTWLQFTAKCKMQEIPLAYHYFVYAGPEGTFRIVGWSMQNLYDRDADQINDVAMTFQFPPAKGPSPGPK